MAWHSVRVILATIALAGLIAGPSTVPARAGFADTLLEKLRPTLLAIGVKPDEIEMAAFTIARPTEASTVYARAAAQDYPFFALVGAAKAARGETLPKIGVFTYDKCVFPITAVDGVFNQASGKISSAKGKADTNAAMQSAASFAASYAQAQTEEARAEAKRQLAEAVPYFGDIETICRFAFETDFTIENDVQTLVSAKARLVRDVYAAMREGDVVTGVKLLMTLGADKQVACSLVDQAVLGGVIGRTPILGQLAKGACAGFVGTVIDGINGLIDGGVGLAEAGVSAAYQGGKKVVCTVYGYFGSGCSKAKAPPPPPTGVQTANAFAAQYCAPMGGTLSVKFPGGIAESNPLAQTPFEFTCKDLTFCSKRPDGPYQCSTGAERAAWFAQQEQLLAAEFAKKLPLWGKEFEARWQAKCPTPNCRAAVALIRANAQAEAPKAKMLDGQPSYALLTRPAFDKAEENAALAVEAAWWDSGPKAWSAGFVAYWSKGCPTPACSNAIRAIADDAVIAAGQARKPNPKSSYAATSTPIYAAAVPKARAVRVDRVQTLRNLTPGGVPQGVKAPGAGTPLPPTQPGVSRNRVPLVVPGQGAAPSVRATPVPSATPAPRIRLSAPPTPTPTPRPR